MITQCYRLVGRRRFACPPQTPHLRVFGRVAVLVAALLCPLISAPLCAQEDFTFRRAKVSDMVPGRLNLVQIDPVEQARRLAATAWKDPALARGAEGGADGALSATRDNDRAPLPRAVSPASKYEWYWGRVPAGLSEGAGRFATALAALSAGPQGAGVAAPRLQSMQALAESYGRDILRATIGTRVSPALVLAVIGIESAGRKDAVSSAGAVGLMQLIPATAERFGVRDSKDPVENIRGGVAYLDWLMGEFDHDPVLVLAAYNAGEGAVRKNAGVPPYAETRDYVPKVLAAWQVAQGLCQTPPELVSDPCVFAASAMLPAAKSSPNAP